MAGYLLRRLVASALLLLLVLSLIFAILQLIPGDPIDRLENPRIPQRQQDRLREIYGFDKPLGQQYFAWLAAVTIRWDWGFSFTYQRPVTEVIADALPNTLLLAVAAIVLQYPMGLAAGILAARRRGSTVDHTVRLGALIVYSTPVLWLGLMAILLFSYHLSLFPPSHMNSPGAGTLPRGEWMLDVLHHLALPALILAAPLAAETARFSRNSLLDALGQDYIRTARARGLGEFRVVWLHGLRNSVAPLIQIFGGSVPFLLSGAFLIEFVFSWPGLGQITMKAIQAQDYPLMLASTAFTGALVVLGNLTADLLHAVADPRVRHGYVEQT